jgi:transposase-like protein
MSKNNCQRKKQKIPESFEGIQINFCKNSKCLNFGVCAETHEAQKNNENIDKDQALPIKPIYKIVTSTKKISSIECLSCYERNKSSFQRTQSTYIMKSNQAVHEELMRISSYLQPIGTICPNTKCDSINDVNKIQIKKKGKTAAGRQRYICKICGTSFTGLIGRHRNPLKSKDNSEILRYLLLGTGIRKLAEGSDVSAQTIYNKIDYFHEQFTRFASERESKLEFLQKKRLCLCTDRQVQVSNWTNRKEKKNCEFYGIATADLNSSYVFAFNFNYDPSLNPVTTNKDAEKEGDYDKRAHLRKYARVWLNDEFKEKSKKSLDEKALLAGGSIEESILLKSKFDDAYNDEISSERFDNTTMLPKDGMEVHNEYTMIAHFYLLKRFTKSVDKTRFYMDQDMGMKTWYLSVFKDEIKNGSSDGFVVHAEKGLTIDQKQRLVRQRKSLISEYANKPFKSMTPFEVKTTLRALIIRNIKKPSVTERSGDVWVEIPDPNINEPLKMISAVTDMDKYDLEHQANLLKIGSLHAVDRFFMQIRRRVSMFERPFQSGANTRKVWYANSPYNPEMYQKLADIYRIYYNYCKPFKKKVNGKEETPATKLGLAKGVVALDKIIYFKKYD